MKQILKHGATVAAISAALLVTPLQAVAYELTILHINDHHSHLKSNNLDMQLGGERTRVKAGGMASVQTKIEELASKGGNVLKLHAGDAITGDLYFALFKGEADAAMMNSICFDAFALGNHEFDDGDVGLAKFLNHLKEGSCNTPVLAANVKPKIGMPLAPTARDDFIIPAVVLERGGEKIGVIGIDIAQKTMKSSNPDPSTQFLDETTIAQVEIDVMRANGVNKIVLLTHIQYENDLAMASKLSGVDVIVGGDSHSLLGDQFEAFGLYPEGPYPTQVKNADGDNVCVATAWEYSNVVGELKVSFDNQGRVTNCGGTPHLLLADSFKRKNAEGKRVELEGEARDAVVAEVNTSPALSIVNAHPGAATILSGYADQVDAVKAEVIGAASSTLCLERIPGQGKSQTCDTAVTASNGSDITNIVAKGFLEMSNTSDIAIQNGGGVRVDVLEGPVSIGVAYTLMPFANTLVEMTMNGAEIKQVLEDAFDFAASEGGSTGAYPYASGLRWHVDRSKPKGQRFSNLEVNSRLAGSWSPIDPGATYKVVTNSYIAGGRDGYLTFKDVSARGDALDTYLDYALSFVEYVKSVGTLNKLPIAEYSTQSYTNENGVKQ